MRDIFDMNDLSDIPFKIKKSRYGASYSFTCQIMELFKIAKRELTMDEIKVGYYRKFGGEKTDKQVFNKVQNLIRYGKIIRIKRSTFKLP